MDKNRVEEWVKRKAQLIIDALKAIRENRATYEELNAASGAISDCVFVGNLVNTHVNDLDVKINVQIFLRARVVVDDLLEKMATIAK